MLKYSYVASAPARRCFRPLYNTSLVYYFAPSTLRVSGRCELIAMYARPSLPLRAPGVYH